MATVYLDTVKLYYEESKAAREQVESLLDRYRTNTSTLLALSTAAVAFFGFSTGPRQPFYWIAIAIYLLAVFMSFFIFVPIPMKVNVGYNTGDELALGPPMVPEKIYYDYALGHQDAITTALNLNPWMGRWFDRRVNSENAF